MRSVQQNEQIDHNKDGFIRQNNVKKVVNMVSNNRDNYDFEQLVIINNELSFFNYTVNQVSSTILRTI